MSVVSPPPNSTTPFVAPPTASSPPPLPSSPAPVSQPDALAPSGTSPPSSLPPKSPPTNPTPSPPASPPLPQSPPPTTPIPSPPASPPLPQSPPPPNVTLPPPTSQPPMASPPPPAASPPPTFSPPPSSPPPPSSTPPVSSPPPPSSGPPASSPPPPKNVPPRPTPPPPTLSPPPPSILPPALSPPPPLQNQVPPPAPQPPENSSPPQSPEPPKRSPPPRKPPANSPPPPASKPPQNSPPPPIPDPHKNSPPSLPPSSSPPAVQLSPPPSFNDVQPSLAPPSPSVPPGGDITKTAGGGGIGTGGTVAVGIIVVLLLLGIIGAAGWCIWKRKKKDAGLNGGYVMPTSVVSSPKSDSALLKFHETTSVIGNGTGSNFVNSPGDPGGLGHSKTWFSYQELVEATNDFSVQNLLGVGGFGSVYKGCLADGRDVAVKQLNIGGGQGDREFRAEVEIISRIHHRHLVSLEGYCISGNRRLLVYDYVPNNTLYFHLHEQGKPVMDWATRVKIAIGAARGIAYLHEDCCPRIIHRDIKSSNILLDNNFEARVSDFGLAKLAEDAMTHVTTRVMGTFGYMAPEYASSGKLTEKSDVYSYGVVLLELISGRKPVDISQPLGEENLVEWSRPLISHALEKVEFDQLADPLLEKNYVDSEMFRMIEAAAACVRHSAAKRPRMGQIMRAFDGMAMSDLTNGMKVGESAIYNSAEQSAEIRLFRRMAFGSQESSNFFSQGTLNSRESGEHG